MTREEMEDNGYEMLKIKVVRFTDDLEDRRWFYRSYQTLGIITTLGAGPRPLDVKECWRLAHEAFGEDISLIY